MKGIKIEHSRVIDNLRPVEAYYLLSAAGKEPMNLKDGRAAICVYLANEGYIKPAKLTFLRRQFIPLALTEKGKSSLSHPDLREGKGKIDDYWKNFDYWEDRSLKDDSLLRLYEIISLKAIDKDKSNDLNNVISDYIDHYDFQGYMTKRGFYQTQEREKGWWIFKWKATDYLPNDQFNKAIQELDELKDQISSAVSQGSQDKYLMNMSFAFPSSGLSTAFLKYASKEIADVADAARNKIKRQPSPQ